MCDIILKFHYIIGMDGKDYNYIIVLFKVGIVFSALYCKVKFNTITLISLCDKLK